MYDVVIIGAGVSGSACARELSKYNLSICVVEKEEDVCCGTSKANSAIVHSGIDCKTGTLMAQMNIRGNEMMDELSKQLDFEFRRNGSLIVCFSEDDMPRLKELYNQGIANGVPGLEILDSKKAHEMEPNLSDEVVAELMPYSGGLKRNIVQCLDDFNIPLKLSHTVVDIKGRERVEGITLAQVDEHNKPIEGTEEFYECDTLLLSCGLIPENEISKTAGVELNPVTSGPVVNESLETNVPGVFACGNVLHVHDLVDYVSEEATAAGRHAAEYVKNGGDKSCDGREVSITATGGVRYTVPSTINTAQMDDTVTVRFRVGAVYKNCYIAVYLDDKQLQHRKHPVMAPGEMEQVVLKKKQLIETENPRTITIKIEEA